MDQIPSKLTQDVIKNTNMKIVHRALAKDDRDYLGSAMNLTEEQSRELSLLGVGQAVIHRVGMDKAFLVQVDRFVGGTRLLSGTKPSARTCDPSTQPTPLSSAGNRASKNNRKSPGYTPKPTSAPRIGTSTSP